MRGTVKWFNGSKGFGFITPAVGGEEIFVHFTAIQSDRLPKNLVDGEPVEYEAERGERGMKATTVRVIEPAMK